MTDVKLEKLPDIDKYLFIEKGSRGGSSCISKRYAKSNNKYMSDYDSNKPSTFFTYLDKNNLYDYPLAPEKLAVTNDMLSKYCKEIADEYDIKVGDAKKLIPNLKKKLNMCFITEIFSCICF